MGQDLSLTTAAPASAQVLDDGDVAALFGLEMAEPAKADAAKVTATSNGRKARLKAKAAPGSKRVWRRRPTHPEATPRKSGVAANADGQARAGTLNAPHLRAAIDRTHDAVQAGCD